MVHILENVIIDNLILLKRFPNDAKIVYFLFEVMLYKITAVKLWAVKIVMYLRAIKIGEKTSIYAKYDKKCP